MKILKPITPNISQKSGYVARPKDQPVPYVKVSGELMNKFSVINEDIFDLGEYMFVPKDLYDEVMNNGHTK